MRYASALGAPIAVILAEEEMSRGNVIVRDMGTSTQEEVAQTQLQAHLLKKNLSAHAG